MFWFRRVVPADLRALVGKREELVSLRTKDASEARQRYAKISAEVETRWANLRSGTRSLTERETHALAVVGHDVWLRWHGEEPSEQFTWTPSLYRRLWTGKVAPIDASTGGATLDQIVVPAMRTFCFKQADNCLAHHGLLVDEYSRLKLAKAFGAAFQRASLTLAELSEGRVTFEEVPALMMDHETAPIPSLPIASSTTNRTRSGNAAACGSTGASSALTMTGLFSAWWREAEAAGRKPSTHESYSNTVKGFVAYLKHDDATRITAEDVVGYKDHRLSTPSPRTGRIPSAKTVKDSDLSALKTLFGWAVMNRKLPANPAAGLTIKVGRKAQVRPKGFVEAEVQAILSAALAYEAGPREHPRTAAAKRWIPWLCAFSGARVGEIAQLRRQDLRREGEWWVMRDRPPQSGPVGKLVQGWSLHQR